jgi:hypothetical protein
MDSGSQHPLGRMAIATAATTPFAHQRNGRWKAQRASVTGLARITQNVARPSGKRKLPRLPRIGCVQHTLCAVLVNLRVRPRQAQPIVIAPRSRYAHPRSGRRSPLLTMLIVSARTLRTALSTNGKAKPAGQRLIVFALTTLLAPRLNGKRRRPQRTKTESAKITQSVRPLNGSRLPQTATMIVCAAR